MVSSLFGRKSSNSGMQNKISQIVGMMNGNPEAYGRYLMQSNPKFAQFVNENMGKSSEQIAREHGLDYSQISPFLR